MLLEVISIVFLLKNLIKFEMSKSALASITAQYTDSENEEQQDDGSDSQNSQVIIPTKIFTPIQTPEKSSIAPREKKRRSKKVRRLVSYQDDTIISDEASTSSSEEDEDEVGTLSIAVIHKNEITFMEVDDDDLGSTKTAREAKGANHVERSNKYSHYAFSLPPEPKGKPVAELTEKIRHLYDKMDSNNMDMNRVIQERKEFRNPSIYEKLIQFCDINEFGTNYPPEIYDPLRWGPESYYEELARVQKNEMLKRQKERKDTDKIEQATALARKVEEEAKKRKSKWDQPRKPAVPPALTTTVTGTKGTVISAFGSLPKKPAA